jgi:hypothetical protein
LTRRDGRFYLFSFRNGLDVPDTWLVLSMMLRPVNWGREFWCYEQRVIYFVTWPEPPFVANTLTCHLVTQKLKWMNKKKKKGMLCIMSALSTSGSTKWTRLLLTLQLPSDSIKWSEQSFDSSFH